MGKPLPPPTRRGSGAVNTSRKGVPDTGAAPSPRKSGSSRIREFNAEAKPDRQKRLTIPAKPGDTGVPRW